MQLISRIIDELTDDSKSLNSALLKTKVLADKITNDSVLNWVNNEIHGYKDDTGLPSYRVLPASAIGTFANRVRIIKNIPIPSLQQDDWLKEFLTKMNILNSVSSLEHHIKKDNGALGFTIPPEFYSSISQQIGNGFYLQGGRVFVENTLIVELLNNVRARLLEFLLRIQKEFKGEGDGDIDKQKVDTIFNGTIINSNVIFSGNENQQSLNYKMNIGDTKTLLNHLKNNNISEDDLIELKDIVISEKPDPITKEYGPKLKEWTAKMLGKAAKGTWKITTTVASKVIAEAISKYYGI